MEKCRKLHYKRNFINCVTLLKQVASVEKQRRGRVGEWPWSISIKWGYGNVGHSFLHPSQLAVLRRYITYASNTASLKLPRKKERKKEPIQRQLQFLA